MHVVADGVNASWMAAARDATQQFHNTSQGCVTIELHSLGDSTELVLTTADGRRTVRQLVEPFEVAPTVRAMLVSFDDVPVPSSVHLSADAGFRGGSSNSSQADLLESMPAEHAQTPQKRAVNVVLGGSVGARTGGKLATPVVGAFGALHSGAWELGITGQWEISYESVGADASRAWSASGLAAGVTLGRRQTLWSRVDLRAGISLAGAMLHQETHHQRPEQWLTRADGRLGAYAGPVLPLYGVFRLRAEVAVDFVPLQGQGQTAAPGIPPLPTWAAALNLGVETNGP
jgi:hypothetical protein